MTNQEQIEEMASDMDYGCTKRDLYPDDAKEIAKALYLLGYRKLDDHAIMVLRKAKGIENRIRKETVKEILLKLESVFAYYDNEDMFSKKAIFECLEEIVKSIGIEIKE